MGLAGVGSWQGWARGRNCLLPVPVMLGCPPPPAWDGPPPESLQPYCSPREAMEVALLYYYGNRCRHVPPRGCAARLGHSGRADSLLDLVNVPGVASVKYQCSVCSLHYGKMLI